MLKKFILLLLLRMVLPLNGSNISDFLKTIPVQHRNEIEFLFHNIFLEQDGAFTIFGDKPVSCAGSFVTASLEATILHPGQVGKTGRSWKTWLKYKDRFPMKKYLLISETCTIKKNGSVVLFIYVINRKRLIQTLNKHLMLFEAELNRKIDPQQLLADLETGKFTFLTSINHHEMLQGILLGYGEHNATLYYKRSKRCSPYKSFPKSNVKLEFSNVENYPMMIVNPVQYMTDIHHPESDKLRKKYKFLHKKISEIYSRGNFLEITLAQLTSSDYPCVE